VRARTTGSVDEKLREWDVRLRCQEGLHRAEPMLLLSLAGQSCLLYMNTAGTSVVPIVRDVTVKRLPSDETLITVSNSGL
jgi:hypothetical protein